MFSSVSSAIFSRPLGTVVLRFKAPSVGVWVASGVQSFVDGKSRELRRRVTRGRVVSWRLYDKGVVKVQLKATIGLLLHFIGCIQVVHIIILQSEKVIS
jgi:hypothetical protein